jgi:GNAT superfamily N-acetyltransferase
VALGTVARLEQEMSAALEPTHQEALAAVQQAQVKHVDETGWKKAGHKRWLWVAATSTVVVFLIHRLRNAAALLQWLGQTLHGILCSDRWRAYDSHSERDAQLCWLLVDPPARSVGLGKRQIHEAVAFCRRYRYEYVFLRSFSGLAIASRLFQSVGFEKVEQRPSERWGVVVVEEWYVLHPFGRRYPSRTELANS